MFDFSNYSAKSKYCVDETSSVPIKEFVGLKTKMYSLLIDDKKVKGGSKRSLKK